MNTFELRRLTDADYPLLTEWMNDPEVAEFWLLAGPEALTRAHVAHVSADGHSVSYLGRLDGEPMSYWELYRADQDALATHYAAESYDGGIHLLLGPSRFRGKGLGAQLLQEVARRMFAEEQRMRRIVAEPDVRNERSVRCFERAGFVRVAELELPIKQAALMVKERARD
ncbi:GNAT family N-acetyltransferase [Flindersiella endophytica]